jgi:TRAP-type mannitol/chloroaromatic compound transport system permease large subunit
MNVPVGDMFMGAVIPGLLLSLGYVVYVLVYARLHPQQAPAANKEELAAFRSGSMTKDILLSFLLPFLLILAVLGSIFAGIATPTEAAGIGALAASLMTAAQGKLSMKVLKEVMSETTFLTSMVFMILVGAAAFSLTFRALQGERLIIEAITQSELSPAAFFFSKVWFRLAVGGYSHSHEPAEFVSHAALWFFAFLPERRGPQRGAHKRYLPGCCSFPSGASSGAIANLPLPRIGLVVA